MVLPVKRWFANTFLASIIAILQTAASAADDWKIIKVSGSDYLSVDNISKFYGLPAGIAASGEKVEFETEESAGICQWQPRDDDQRRTQLVVFSDDRTRWKISRLAY